MKRKRKQKGGKNNFKKSEKIEKYLHKGRELIVKEELTKEGMIKDRDQKQIRNCERQEKKCVILI